MKPFNLSNTDESSLYKELFYRYAQRVFGYILGKIKDRENAKDISQNVFIHLWRYRKSLDSENAERIIFKTCNQEISKFLKKKKKILEVKATSSEQNADASEHDLQEKLAYEERLESVRSSLEQLPPLRKQIFVLNKLEGATQEEIANQFNISKRTVESHVSKALIFLKRIHGFTF